MSDFKFDGRQGYIRSGWNPQAILMGKPLSDRKIAEYQKRGWYSAEYRAACRDLMVKKKAKQLERDGSFIKDGGRLIYSPKI